MDYRKYKLLFGFVVAYTQPSWRFNVKPMLPVLQVMKLESTNRFLFNMAAWFSCRIIGSVQPALSSSSELTNGSLLVLNYPLAPVSYRYGASQVLKGPYHSPDGQRRCTFFPASSSSSASSSTSSLPSSSFPSSSQSPGCRVKQVASSHAQPQFSRGHRPSKVPFAKGSS